MRTVLKFLLLFPLLALHVSTMQARAPHTIADISGDGMVHAISATKILASQVQFQSSPHNSATTCGSSAISGCLRYGDANISTSRGTYLVPGQAGFYAPSTVNNGSASEPLWDLSAINYLVQIGDVLTIVWYD